MIFVGDLVVVCPCVAVKFVDRRPVLRSGRSATRGCTPRTWGSFEDYETVLMSDLVFLRVGVYLDAMKGMSSEL